MKDAPSFTVQVDAWCPVFSNLTRDPKPGLFTGTTNGVTFIGGLTEEWTEGGLRRIASPLILQLPVDLEKIRSEAAELASYFPGLILENPADGLQTIIAQPEVSSSGALKTYKDHAITGETGATNEEIAESLVPVSYTHL